MFKTINMTITFVMKFTDSMQANSKSVQSMIYGEKTAVK